MKTLQLIVDYFGTDLYKKYIGCLEKNGINNFIFVPLNKKEAYVKQNNVKAIPCFNSFDRFLFRLKQRKILKIIKKEYNIESFNIIHAHTLFSSGYVAEKLHKEYGIPYIVAIRNVDVNVFFKYMVHLRNTGIKIMLDAQNVIFLSEAYKNFVLNKLVPNKYKNQIDEKSIVIPNGIDDYFLKNKANRRALDRENIHIIYIGEINDNKNILKTIDAIKILRNEGYNIDYTVVGEIKNEKIKEILCNEGFIRYFPKCKKEDVKGYLNKCDIFVMPSYKETFGLVYAEAMSQGLPVLYTKGQGFDKQFPDATVGYPILPDSSNDIANKIKYVIKDYEDISANCLKYVEKFDWNHIALKYKKIYERKKENM